MGGVRGRVGEEVRGLRSANRRLQNGGRDVNYNIGSGLAQELICVVHGHNNGPWT